MRNCGWVTVEKYYGDLQRTAHNATVTASIKNEEIIIRAEKVEEMEKLYRSTMKTAAEERARWHDTPLKDAYDAARTAAILGERFLLAFEAYASDSGTQHLSDCRVLAVDFRGAIEALDRMPK